MRNIIVLACVSLIVVGCVSGPKSGDQPKNAPGDSVKAPVAQKTAKNVEVTERTPIITKEILAFSDGTVDQYVVYQYDASKKLLLSKTTYNASSQNPQEKTVWDYKDTVLASETAYDENGNVKNRHRYEIDPDGRVSVDTLYDAKDKVVSVQKIAYNAAGNRSEWKSYGAGDVIRAVSSYLYEKNLLVAVEMKDGVGLPMGSTKYSYDSNGNLLKREYFDKKGVLEKYDELIWNDGVLSEEKIYGMKNALMVWMLYSQYADGVPRKKTVKDGQGTVVDIRTYEYDVRETKKTVQVWE